MNDDSAVVYMYNFQYVYDAKKQKFIVPQELNCLIKADLLWDWIEDHDLFNVKIVEKKKGIIKYSPELGQDDVFWTDLP